MQKYGETIYGTRGNYIPPQEWGVVTAKNKTVYAHVMQVPGESEYIFIPGLKEKVVKTSGFADKSQLKFKQLPEGLFIYINGLKQDDADTVIQIDLK